MIKEENFFSSEEQSAKPGYVEQAIEVHNTDDGAHPEKFGAVIKKLDEHIAEMQEALNLKANAGDVYSKTESYSQEEINTLIKDMAEFHGTIASVDDLPKNPTEGTFYYVQKDVSNGVLMRGKASDFFEIEETYIMGTKNAPESCVHYFAESDVGYENAEGEVYAYREDGSMLGRLWYREKLPAATLDLSSFGATSTDDTVSFYLGHWDGEHFPDRVVSFSAGNMIFWNGERWCALQSAAEFENLRMDLDAAFGSFQAVLGTKATQGVAVLRETELPENPSIGVVYEIGVNAALITGIFSDFFAGEDFGFTQANIRLPSAYNEYLTYGTFEDSPEIGCVWVYNSDDGSLVDKFCDRYPSCGYLDNFHGFNGSPDDIVSFYLCKQPGMDGIVLNGIRSVYWNGVEWVDLPRIEMVGDISCALDAILEIQRALIGGEDI